MSDLVKRLRIKAGMIEMGERIAWGSDSALMREAADALEMAAQGEPVAWLPYLVDRADGVTGHYAIARKNPAGYREVWNLRHHHWAAFSDEVLTMDEALAILEKLEMPTAPQPSFQLPEFATKPDDSDEVASLWDHGFKRGWNSCLGAVAKTMQPEEQQPISHDWDDQDKCRRCGDRDWYASATCSPNHQTAPDVADYEQVLDDHRHLTRELDVLLNGEEGAAQQASLADLVAQLRTVVRNTGKPVLAAPDVSWLVEALDGAARSLETISRQAGIDEYMHDFLEVRGYARNRALVAFEALATYRNQGADQ